jgi:translation elongation factor EF-G
VPALAFVNKMDREGADLDKALDSIGRRLGEGGRGVAGGAMLVLRRSHSAA